MHIAYAFVFLVLSLFGYFWVRRFNRNGKRVLVEVIRPTTYTHGVVTPWVPDRYKIVSGEFEGIITPTSWRRVPRGFKGKTYDAMYLELQNRAETRWTLLFFENLYKAGFLAAVIVVFTQALA